ncbi:MAG: ComEC/Rec2 family competence protein [Bdellovibrio sp.]|nr:ComEC/Rec2 family competence protein [Bdellovibrio sp.]
MALVYLSIITLTIAASLRFSVHSLLQPVSLLLHQSCLERLPVASKSLPELQALVCGQGFSDAASSQLYVATGLIHLFVVSGAHLILLETILKKVPIFQKSSSRILILIALFIYVLACEMNPPITRSFISLLFSGFLIKNRLNWPASFKIFLIGIITLAMNPEWANSASLQLSWIAGLVVALNTCYFSKHTFLFRQSLYFILLWPLLIFLSVPSHLVILMNLIFTPILEFILFPLGLVTWVLPFLHPLFDLFIEGLNAILKLLEFKSTAQTTLDLSALSSMGWFIIFGLHFCLHLFEMNHRKGSYV